MNQDIDLNSWAFYYSISGEPGTFRSYVVLSKDILELFHHQQDGNATIFRMYCGLAAKQVEIANLLKAKVSPVKHLLTWKRPLSAEQITITPLMHMSQMQREFDNLSDQFDEVERERDDLDDEKDELEEENKRLTNLSKGVDDDTDLATEMHQKNQLYGWSARECLDYLFRDRQFCGEVKA